MWKSLFFRKFLQGILDLHQDALYQHKLKRHTERSTEFPCSKCDKKFSLKCHLDAHIKVIHVLEPIACEICGKVLDNSIKLRNHIQYAHSGVVRKNEPKEYDKSDWTCPICSKVVVAHYKNKHLQIHKEPKYTCDICGRKLKTKKNLDQHMNIHMSKLDFKCEPCNKVFLLFLLALKIISGICVKRLASTTSQTIRRPSKRKLELFPCISCTATVLKHKLKFIKSIASEKC